MEPARHGTTVNAGRGPRRVCSRTDGGRRRPARLVWLAAGWTLFAVGVVGIVLPGLPTTGPMLLALACFARGSQRLHTWLLHHRLFGRSLRRWQEHRVIPIHSKVVAVSMMAASFAYVVWLSPLPAWAHVVIGGLIAVGMYVVLRVPHKVTEGPTRSDDSGR